MIELFKLLTLPHTQKIRKIIKILELLEYESAESASGSLESDPAASLSCDSFYIDGLCKHIAALYPNDEDIKYTVDHYTLLVQKGRVELSDVRRLCNILRHALYRHTGVQPSEWDLIAPGRRYGTGTQTADTQNTASNLRRYPANREPQTVSAIDSGEMPKETSRSFYRGLYVYAEDIRAPFNLGSIFRTAEAFGAERLFLSQGCVAPEQPRAQRSAMGCTRFLPWEYRPLDSLPSGIPVFALETGGTPITSFSFPAQGIVLIGSEELGLSAEALKKVSAGVVSIPMKGIKASLNVAVAFGILMQYWTAALSGQAHQNFFNTSAESTTPTQSVADKRQVLNPPHE